MTKRKYTRAFTRPLRQVVKLYKALKSSTIRWLTRFLRQNFRRQPQGGFVLPTTVMLLLIVTLVVTALIFRTFSRTSQVISERQQQVIYNSATPAVDRAKAKLEYLFRQDTRLPAGVASDSTIQSILEAPASGTDLYTLPDEKRLSNFVDANNNKGIGWYFTQNDKTIAYSIVFKKQVTNAAGTTTLAEIKDTAATKAPLFVVRNGPVNTSQSTTDKCGGTVQLSANEKDWEPITSATLAKTFQVNAFVVDNAQSANRAVTTLELQQDRQVDKGNKWGAYFRYDFELFPGPKFRWNGAMHSDGSMFFAPDDLFKSYLISSSSSCVNNSASDSRVTVSTYTNVSGATTFQGQIVAGQLKTNDYATKSSSFDLYGNNSVTENESFDADKDSIKLASGSTIKPADFALDPVKLYTEDVFQARGGVAPKSNESYRDPNWKTRNVFTKRRIFNEAINPPYLDDTYRADNRYGPNPTYDGKPISSSLVKVPSGSKVGDPITSANAGLNFDALTRPDPPDVKNPEALGLDGYWERRAVKGGLRVIVGQRLELSEPQLPTNSVTPTGMGRENEFLQRRTQRDNLAAVQATAVYHYQSGSGTTPIACLATTVHPGTAGTLQRSATFDTISFQGAPPPPATPPAPPATPPTLTPLITDFFTGRGTNGWEFSVPASSTALTSARQNLANFAGDPDGAFPPKQEASSSTIMHPYPEMTKYGNFSELRRSLTGTTVADTSYQDTANCMLGMLAYNISYLNDYVYANNWGTGAAQLLDELNTALNSITASTPEQAIAALPANQQALARLIATKEQVRRDRGNGKESDGTTDYGCDFTTTDNTKATYINDGSDGVVKAPLNKLCPSGDKYKALYYIFPNRAHNDARSDTYITGTAVNGTTNIYTEITDANITSIKTTPNTGTWTTPRSAALATTDTGITSIPGQPNSLPNSNATNLNNLVKYTNASGTTVYHQVAFKDAALFNGREMMSVRTLDIDLNLLRTTTGPGTDKWLPINDNSASNPNAPPPTGLVYAFREDAVREDGIARPISTATDTKLRMNAKPGSLSDPEITSSIGISTKAVDYYPDPDRRPYGFRLLNGSRLDRGTNTAGMSFVSDNAVYIQGNFNLHSTDGTTSNLLEEFKDNGGTQGTLKDDWSNFYTRSTKDDRFAKPATDTWRPTEVLADAVNILSNQFCAGSIQDGIINAGANGNSTASTALTNYGCSSGATYTSYLNQNRPYLPLTSTIIPAADRSSGNNWIRTNPYDTTSPVELDPNGKPRYCTDSTIPCPNSNQRSYELISTPDTNYPDSYLKFNKGDPNGGSDSGSKKSLGRANATRVNAVIVQGIIPSQSQQSYGGLSTFPRMIEEWDGLDLSMLGAFIQLRFSTQNTGLLDQDAWEPGNTPITDQLINHFRPPNRKWGYDVALQFQTAGPVSRRFAVPGTTRSEVYRELAVDDPYIARLRCAKKDAADGGTYIDTAASCS